MQEETLFYNVYPLLDIIANNSYKKNINLHHLNLTLYFCFTFYANQFGKNKNYPKYLFNQGYFIATDFGPKLIIEHQRHEWLHEYIDQKTSDYEIPEDVFDLIIDVAQSCNELDEFQLSDRSHMDDCWKNHFRKEDDVIPFEEIWEEYINKDI